MATQSTWEYHLIVYSTKTSSPCSALDSFSQPLLLPPWLINKANQHREQLVVSLIPLLATPIPLLVNQILDPMVTSNSLLLVFILILMDFRSQRLLPDLWIPQ